MTLKTRTSLLLIILLSVTIPPASARRNWYKDDLNDWFNLNTGEPKTGIDWLDIRKTSIHKRRDNLILSTHVKTPITPEERPNSAAFWWSLDTDKNPNTGLTLEHLSEIGFDYAVRVKYYYETETWTAVLFSYDKAGNQDAGTPLDTFSIRGTTVVVHLPHAMIEDDGAFNWVSNTFDYTAGADKGMITEYATY